MAAQRSDDKSTGVSTITLCRHAGKDPTTRAIRSDSVARMERRAGADAMDYALFRWTIRPFPKGLCPFPNEYALFRWRAPFSHELRPYPKGIIRPFPKLYDQHSRDGHAGKDDRATSPTSTPARRFGLTPFSNGLRPHPKGFRPFPMDHVLSRIQGYINRGSRRVPGCKGTETAEAVDPGSKGNTYAKQRHCICKNGAGYICKSRGITCRRHAKTAEMHLVVF